MERFLHIRPVNFEKAFQEGMDFFMNAATCLDKKTKNNMILAFEEVYVNILQYNKDKNDLDISVAITSDNNRFIVRISDNGKRFNPLLKEEPNFSLSADEMDIGGMGIYIVKQVTDTVEYEYTDNRNVLTFGVKTDEKD